MEISRSSGSGVRVQSFWHKFQVAGLDFSVGGSATGMLE